MKHALPTAIALFFSLFLSAPVGAYDLVPLPEQPPDVPWPTETWPEGPMPSEVDEAALLAEIKRQFAGDGTDVAPGLQALLIVYRGRIVYEGYAPGFGAQNRWHGQSVTKSYTAALVGILAKDGKLDISARAPVPEWQVDPGDVRANITLDDLLHMSSGLAFREDYDNPFNSDALPMLFGEGRYDTAHLAASAPALYVAGTYWYYSSGTTNIVSRIVRDSVGGNEDSYRAFIRTRLQQPIGITNTVFEFDGAGTFVGSSFVHATPRDFARFGLLCLRDGVWDGYRILPEGWMDYVRTPAPVAPRQDYGAHFWLNTGVEGGDAPKIIGGPRDVFMARGYGGQAIIMVPSKDLIIVRNGHGAEGHWNQIDKFFGVVISAFPDLTSDAN